MHVVVVDAELHLPVARSLKAKRSIVQSVVRTLDQWHSVAAAETGHLELWQRTRIGVVIVGGSVSRLGEVADSVERYLWAVPDTEVISIQREWPALES